MSVWHSHIGIVVEDLEKAFDFWTEVLNFIPVRFDQVTPESQTASACDLSEALRRRVHWLRHGNFQVKLIDYVNLKDPKVLMGPMDVHASHQGFYTDDFMKDYNRIKAGGARFLSEPDEAASTLHGQDWDGNWFQLIKTAATAEIPRGQLPLDGSGFGHAHSAIVVENIDNAISFYRDLLGMEEVKWHVMEPSPRFVGTRLEGVRLQEAWLRKGDFMIELIEYGNKQDVTLDMHVTDVHCTHVGFFCDNLEGEHARLTSAGVRFLGELRDAHGNTRDSIYAKDLDGNWFELINASDDGRGMFPKP